MEKGLSSGKNSALSTWLIFRKIRGRCIGENTNTWQSLTDPIDEVQIGHPNQIKKLSLSGSF